MRGNCRSAENLVGNPPTSFMTFGSPFTVRRLAFGVLISVSDFCSHGSVLHSRETNRSPNLGLITLFRTNKALKPSSHPAGPSEALG